MIRIQANVHIIKDIDNNYKIIAYGNMSKCVIIISGLPASGKSTIGKQLAQHLGVRCLDKDDFLEALFEERGVSDLSWRLKLSLESNAEFQKEARTYNSVVLVSHWRSYGNLGTSGTPTEWLLDAYETVIEIFCDCATEKALNRFKNRTRHIGHCDKDRSEVEISEQFENYRKNLPLNIGHIIKVNSSMKIDINDLVAQVINIRCQI